MVYVFFASQTAAKGRVFVRVPDGWTVVGWTAGGVWCVRDGLAGRESE